MEKHEKIAIIGSVLVLVVMLGLGALALMRYLAPSTETMSLEEYYKVPQGEALIIMDDKLYSKNAKLLENEVYVDLETVQQRFNKRFYWDEAEQILTLTTPDRIIRMMPGQKLVQENGVDVPYTDVIFFLENGVPYISLKFVAEFSDMRYETYTASGAAEDAVQRVMITCTYGDYLYVNTNRRTQIRVEGDRKSAVLKELDEGETLMILDGGGTGQGSFYTVMSADGVRGYVDKKHLDEAFYQKVVSSYVPDKYESISMDEPINMAWHYVETMSANDKLGDILANVKGLNVISPTWFRLDGNEGEFRSIASEEYVTKAHALGLKVWALVKNFDTGAEVDSYQVLSRTSSRERLAAALVQEAVAYALDGINVDFELISLETGPHYVQFLRELSVLCRQAGLVLSVDNYVPTSYNKYYDYAEQGVVVDYVVIMAYDEHTSVSGEAGSVASISYVEQAIADTVAMVPAEKVIVGIPFYTRLWKETGTEDGTAVSIAETPFMSAQDKLLSDNDVTAVWDEATAQYYVEYEKDGAKYRMWMEEETSIAEKIKRVTGANAAGVAAWRLGQEKKEIWDVIYECLNGAE